MLDPGNSRLYAIKPEGDSDGNLMSGPSPFVDGWPAKVAILGTETLPVVGEGMTGSPILSEFSCPSGGDGPKVGAISAVGPGYVFNADGTSCYGKAGAVDITLESDVGVSPTTTDRPAIPAFGQPVFGNLDPAAVTMAAPAAGLKRALDVGLNDYQMEGQDMVAAWAAESPGGQMRPGFPARVNDLQFLNGPAIADIDGAPGDTEEIIEGSAHNDLAAYTAAGTEPAGGKWPKTTSDWMVDDAGRRAPSARSTPTTTPSGRSSPSPAPDRSWPTARLPRHARPPRGPSSTTTTPTRATRAATRPRRASRWARRSTAAG